MELADVSIPGFNNFVLLGDGISQNFRCSRHHVVEVSCEKTGESWTACVGRLLIGWLCDIGASLVKSRVSGQLRWSPKFSTATKAKCFYLFARWDGHGVSQGIQKLLGAFTINPTYSCKDWCPMLLVITFSLRSADSRLRYTTRSDQTIV